MTLKERLAAFREQRLSAATLVALQDDTWSGSQERASRRSVALDLAFEQYLEIAEDPAQVQSLLARHHDLQHSLCRLIQVHRHVVHGPADSTSRWPEAGETFLGLQLLSELGRGGLSRVFLATQPDMGGRLVVVKVSSGGEQEAAIHGPLNHPNIVPVYSRLSSPDQDLSGLCMPFEGAATLGDLLDFIAAQGAENSETILEAANLTHLGDSWEPSDADRPVRSDAATGEEAHRGDLIDQVDEALLGRSYVEGVVHLVQQLADALAYTHSQGVVHNDIKPSNVLLTPAGRPKLMDFNLSADARLQARRAGGTLPYMAPERIDELFHEGPPADAPEKADLYSLGAVLYQLLCGVNPLESAVAADAAPEEAAAAIRERQQKPPGFKERAWRHTPAALRRLIASCLAEDPAHRPRSASELRQQLELALQPVAQAPWAKPSLWAAAVLGGMLMVCGLGGDEASPAFGPPRSAEFLTAMKACEARQFAKAAEGFRLAYEAEADPRCLAWRLYCLLCDAKNPYEAGRLFDELKQARYAGRELQINYAAHCSLLNPFPKEIADAELDHAVAEQPSLLTPRVARAYYCVRRDRNTRAITDYGSGDIDVALQMAGPDAGLDLVFLAAKVHANAYRHLHGAMNKSERVSAERRIRDLISRCHLLGLKGSTLKAIATHQDNPLRDTPWWKELDEQMQGNQRRAQTPQLWMYAKPTWAEAAKPGGTDAVIANEPQPGAFQSAQGQAQRNPG